MSKEQVISRLEEQVYLPEDTTIYRWAIYQTPEENYSLWLISEDQQAYFITVGEPLRRIEELDLHYGSLDEKGFPLQIEGFTRLSQKSIVQIIDDLGKIEFGEPPLTIHIQSLSKAAAMQPLYEYDKSRDILINQQTGDTYSAVDGTFISESGEALSPGYIVFVGFRNFEKFLGNKGYRDPLGKIIIWNFAFAILSVFISLAIGMIASIMFEDLPGKRIIRSLLIIPWPIPVLVSVLIWRYMLHPDLGFIAQILESIFGSSPQWFSGNQLDAFRSDSG